jgi:ubiquinone/menaquinone biosynthesis C-methylase UbiE
MVDNDVWGAAAHIRTADRWHSSAANWNSALTQALLDSANLHQTCLVVDVAAGSGDPALSIAHRLREGRVVAIDSSRPGLLLAKYQGEDLGLGSKLRLVQADAHKLPLANSSVDRVTCRCGIMFFTHIDTALTEMRHVLKPGGRAAFLAWGEFEQPFFESTIGVVLRLVPGTGMPEPARAMFRFAAPGSIGDALRHAGFRNIEARHISLPRIWVGSPQDLWQYFQEISTMFHSLIRAIPANMRREVDEAVCIALARFQRGDTITVPAQVVLATAESQNQ